MLNYGGVGKTFYRRNLLKIAGLTDARSMVLIASLIFFDDVRLLGLAWDTFVLGHLPKFVLAVAVEA